MKGSIADGALAIRASEVLRYLGYAGQQMTPQLQQRVDQVIERCAAEQRAYGYWESHPVRRAAGENDALAYAVEDTKLTLRGNDIAAYLEGAQACVLLACTLGMESERTLKRLGTVNPLDALIYSAACSEAIEHAADQLEAGIIAAAHDRGLFANHRYSPGYGDFNLDIQVEFVRTLHGGERLGLAVTESNMLVPEKSITAVVGLYPKRPKGYKVSCNGCVCRQWCTIRAHGDRCFGGHAGVSRIAKGSGIE